MSYTLHSTFRDIPSENLTRTQMKKLCKILSSLDDEEKKKAVFLLIAEHYRKEGNVIDIGNYSIPYGGKIKHNNIIFDLKNMPVELQWILWKFLNLEEEN